MKRSFLSIAGFFLSALVLCAARVANVMAANPTEVVVVSCEENNPGSGYSVINYDNSSGSPAQSSTDCATEVEALLNSGLTNVNLSVQTYSTEGGYGAPGEVNGTYITYVLTNGTASGTNPTEAVLFSCLENNPGSGYSVINYDNSSGSPAQSSSDCAAEFVALLNAGLTNSNLSVQTYTYTGTKSEGAPGGVEGTYITYFVTNGTVAGSL
jgi:hypothetical protein